MSSFIGTGPQVTRTLVQMSMVVAGIWTSTNMVVTHTTVTGTSVGAFVVRLKVINGLSMFEDETPLWSKMNKSMTKRYKRVP